MLSSPWIVKSVCDVETFFWAVAFTRPGNDVHHRFARRRHGSFCECARTYDRRSPSARTRRAHSTVDESMIYHRYIALRLQ
jgi:hypothetical protein